MKSLQPSQQEAARELLRRRRARKNLVDFARYTNRDYIPANHHHLICEKLEAVADGRIKRLMIFMPPRHGKSELASRRFPAWFLGNYPKRSIIAASYNSELAGDFGRDVRNIVGSKEYSSLFDVKLAADSKAAGRWHTDSNGGYVAAGVGTAITGRGAHILLIDDPFKDRESADSEIIREKTYKWYLSTAYTRLEGSITEQDSDDLWNDQKQAMEEGEAFDGAIVIIQTRWHEDDLSGRLLEDMKNGADEWDVLSLPAIDDNGNALWPEKYPIERLNGIKSALTRVSMRDWESLYQQRPKPDEGTFFRREWFKRFSLGDEPKVNKYQSTDFAVTDGGGDFTELGIIGLCPDFDLWCLDWWHGQTSSDVWVEEQLKQIKLHSPLASFGETGVIRRSVEPLVKMMSRQERIYPRLEWITRTGDKPSMARAFQGMAANGKVHIPYTDWGNRIIEQLVAFPAGKHDDAVDVLALFAMAIQSAHPAIINKPQESDPVDLWGRRFKGDRESWKVG